MAYDILNNVARRKLIAKILIGSDKAVSASFLAEKFAVSRQIIVGDIAIMRAQGIEVLSTPRGYVAVKLNKDIGHCFKIACQHNDKLVKEELYVVVDNGGRVVDVVVEHPIYGQITGQLDISSRYDVDDFIMRMDKNSAVLLSDLTGGVHLHTITCKDITAKQRIKQCLTDINVLLVDE